MMQRVGFRHLMRLTDDVGLLEHAHYFIPRREEGYTTDDNARALWCVLWWLPLLSPGPLARKLEDLAETYLAFLRWNQQADGTFYNNIDYRRQREPESPSDDCFGRTLWALAFAAAHAPHSHHRHLVQELLRKALPHVQQIRYPRGCAYALAACVHLARTPASSADSASMTHAETAAASQAPTAATKIDDLSTTAARFVPQLAAQLAAMYQQAADETWRWYEPILTYSNGVLPWAMLVAGDFLKDDRYIRIGIDSLDFLIQNMRHPTGGFIEPVGNRQWCTRTVRSIWDQQPIDVFKLALALDAAYRVTGDDKYGQLLVRCRQWFYGDNRHQAVMCVPEEGAGLDGLNEDGPNPNAGAESTLAYLMTERLFFEHMTRTETGHAYRIDVDDETVTIHHLTGAICPL